MTVFPWQNYTVMEWLHVMELQRTCHMRSGSGVARSSEAGGATGIRTLSEGCKIARTGGCMYVKITFLGDQLSPDSLGYVRHCKVLVFWRANIKCLWRSLYLFLYGSLISVLTYNVLFQYHVDVMAKIKQNKIRQHQVLTARDPIWKE